MRIIVIVLLSLLMVACSGNGKDQYKGQNAHYIYASGHKYLQKGDFSEAKDAFESLNSQYPFEKSSKQGDLELIYAYYKIDDPALALAASERFLRLYPNDPGAAYAYYMSGVIDYNNGRGLLETYFPYEMSRHLASNYITAYNTFKIVITQFPKSPYAKDARRRMIALKNIMAQFQMNVAEFYFKRGAYVATIDRAKRIIINYPRSTSVLPAIKLTETCYNKLGLTKLANSMKALYKANQ